MRRILAIALSILLLTTGCSTVRYVDLTDDETPVEDVNRSLKRTSATVLLRGGTRLRVKHVSLALDCTTLTVRAPASRDTVLPTWRIDQITVTSRVRGALTGGLGGLLAGAIIGGLLSAATYSEEDANFIVPTQGDAAALGTFFGGLIGFGVGLVAGGVVGYQDTYDIWAGSSPAECE